MESLHFLNIIFVWRSLENHLTPVNLIFFIFLKSLNLVLILGPNKMVTGDTMYKVISDLVTRQMLAYYMAAHYTFQTKNIQNMATFI